MFLCVFVVRLYRAVQALQNSHKAQESEMSVIRTHDIEGETTRIDNKNVVNRKVAMCKTVYNEGDNYKNEYAEVSNPKLGEETNERTESHVVSDQRVDLCFSLDKVVSEL